MSVEFDVTGACEASLDAVGFFDEKEESKSSHFHGGIFVPPYYPQAFSQAATLDFQTQEREKANAAMLKNLGLKKTAGYHEDPSYSAEVSASIGWGGGETTYSLEASGRAQDDSGNYAEVSVSQSSDGSGGATVSAGRESNGN